jgi:hypothetical protein
MWIQTSNQKLINAHPTRVDTIQLRTIMHSESFGIFFNGNTEQFISCGEDLDFTEGILQEISDALATDIQVLDLRKKL